MINDVTEVDKAAEKLIADFIKKKYPSHGILAEESGQVKSSEEYLWVIDPLDGTTNFAHGLPVFSVSIALQKKGNTIAGVVYDVIHDISYSAEKGSGAFANDIKMKVSTKRARGVRRLGSAALDLAYVAKGVFDGYWEMELNPWDICAGMLLVEEAGGLVSDFNSNPIDMYTKRILASNGQIHKQMMEVLLKEFGR